MSCGVFRCISVDFGVFRCISVFTLTPNNSRLLSRGSNSGRPRDKQLASYRWTTVSSERHWQSGVNGIAKVPKRKVLPKWDSNHRPSGRRSTTCVNRPAECGTVDTGVVDLYHTESDHERSS